MATSAIHLGGDIAHPVDVSVKPALDRRNRLTTAFRFILAIPHLILVGGPLAVGLSALWSLDSDAQLGAGGGVLGAVAGIAAVIGWFWILFTGEYPEGLRGLATFYLRWRVRAVSYVTLLRDEYPPFGDAGYPASLQVGTGPEKRNRWSVALRIVLVLPHLLVVWALGLAWVVTTLIAWCAILINGRYPPGLYDFGVGVLRWNTRVEAYLLLLHDEYPPFSLS